MSDYYTKKMLITPEIAKKMLENNYEKNRSIKRGALATYAKDMKNGNWRSSVCPPICFSENGVLLDGQHRLLAVIEANVAIEFEIRYGLIENDYNYFDQGTKRQASDGLMDVKGRKIITSVCRTAFIASNNSDAFINNGVNMMGGRNYSKNSIVSTTDVLTFYYNFNATYPDFFDNAVKFSNHTEIEFSKWTRSSVVFTCMAMFLADRYMYENFKEVIKDKKNVKNSVLSYKRWGNTHNLKGYSTGEKWRIEWNAAVNVWKMLYGYEDCNYRNFSADTSFHELNGFKFEMFKEFC